VNQRLDVVAVEVLAAFEEVELDHEGEAGDLPTEALHEAAEMAKQGRLRVTVAATYPFSRAGDAHRQSQEGHTRGKIVLLPD